MQIKQRGGVAAGSQQRRTPHPRVPHIRHTSSISVLPEVASLLASQPAVLAGGGALLAGVAAGLAWWSKQGGAGGEEGGSAAAAATMSAAETSAPPPPRENAVLVLGASGRVGRKVVQRLISAGRTVVAAARTAETAEKVLTQEAGLASGIQPGGSGVLFFEGADVRDVSSLRRPGLWQGVRQVVLVVAGRAGMLPSGTFGYFDGLSPEEVEAKGVANLVSVLPDVLPKEAEVKFKSVVPMGSAEEVAVWQRMDDVIMVLGGQGRNHQNWRQQGGRQGGERREDFQGPAALGGPRMRAPW